MNEDFVSFELAKKLKEKGFKQKCLAYYDVEDNVGLLYNTQYTDEALPCQYTDLLQCHNTGEAETKPDDSGFCVDAPTISQVLKWLRKMNIILAINPSYFKGECCFGWDCDIWENANYNHRCVSDNSYEEAAIAGIEYVIDNLI